LRKKKTERLKNKKKELTTEIATTEARASLASVVAISVVNSFSPSFGLIPCGKRGYPDILISYRYF
jgi:hypothetical protein